MGIKYYDDVNEPIPRGEVEVIAEIVKRAVTKVGDNFQLITGGSYRRGEAFSGDVDVVITHPDGRSHLNLIDSLASIMQRDPEFDGFLVHAISQKVLI
jgi:DNA polymerase lambda